MIQGHLTLTVDKGLGGTLLKGTSCLNSEERNKKQTVNDLPETGETRSIC